jgi:3,4-dihydroxy 2-butanone 4-phosphate synthase
MPGSDITHEFDSIEDTIAAFRTSSPPEFFFPTTWFTMTNPTSNPENGEFIVVLDDLSRENEGDLIIAASDVTTEKMAFMIRHTSGLICTPIPPSLCESLDLPQMVTSNEDPNRTAYTISIDTNSPLTSTGISAHDRALTCRTLSSEEVTRESFRRPGHVFPLRARDGGVRERTGHTEAAVEFCRLAGKPLVGVICEMVVDGEEVAGKAERKEPGMMRRDECVEFGKTWGLKVCTIEDLVKYVESTEGKLAKNGLNGS